MLTHADAEHERDQPAQGDDELVEGAHAGEVRQLGQQRGQHRLEEEERDAGGGEAVGELAGRAGLVVGPASRRRSCSIAPPARACPCPAAANQLRGDLAPRRFGARLHQAVLTGQGEGHTDEGGHGHGHAVEADRGPTHGEQERHHATRLNPSTMKNRA